MQARMRKGIHNCSAGSLKTFAFSQFCLSISDCADSNRRASSRASYRAKPRLRNRCASRDNRRRAGYICRLKTTRKIWDQRTRVIKVTACPAVGHLRVGAGLSLWVGAEEALYAAMGHMWAHAGVSIGLFDQRQREHHSQAPTPTGPRSPTERSALEDLPYSSSQAPVASLPACRQCSGGVYNHVSRLTMVHTIPLRPKEGQSLLV